MTNPMASSDQVPERFNDGPPASLYEAHMAMHEEKEAEPKQQFGQEVEEPTEVSRQEASASGVNSEDIREALRDVIDPELGINVVDLGLLYGVFFSGPEEVTLEMTLTSAACPLTDVIEDQARTVLAPLVDNVVIQWVWMPPWGPDCITDEGREQLRALGFNV